MSLAYSQIDLSSLSSDSVSCSCSLGSNVYLRMLLSSRGTLVQCCIGEMSRSVSCSRLHLWSWLHHCEYSNQFDTSSFDGIRTLGVLYSGWFDRWSLGCVQFSPRLN